jgi:hypothetical protein
MAVSNQLELIHQKSTWMHFIGSYYDSTDKFIREAEKYGISRRAPYQAVRGMQFGDRLVCLRYFNKQQVAAFAEATITGITLDHEIAKEVGERLKAEGKAEYNEPASGGGTIIARECGSFILCGSWSVTCSLVEVMDIAEEIAKQKDIKLSVMVFARLVSCYDKPVYLQPTPKFSRGFMRGDDSQFISPDDHAPEQTVFAIQDYQKAARKPRRTSSRSLPLLPEASAS